MSTTKYKRKLQKTRQLDLFMRLGGRCAICGFIPLDVCQIDIHEPIININKLEFGKYIQPSRMMKKLKGYLILIKHIEKLIPLCKNCHVLTQTKKYKIEIDEKIIMWLKYRHSQ
jgi:hypothetical protein